MLIGFLENDISRKPLSQCQCNNTKGGHFYWGTVGALDRTKWKSPTM